MSRRSFRFTPEQQKKLAERRRREGLEAGYDRIRPRAERGSFPLSSSQRRLWFIDQMEGPSAAYNMPSGVRFTGRLHVRALEHSLSELERRHEILRTVFPANDGEPYQKVLPAEGVELPTVSLSGLPKAVREREARRLTREVSNRPFDLAAKPPRRFVLLVLAPEVSLLLVNLHHIISDGFSTIIFLRELAAQYGSFLEARPSSLPEPAVQFGDFAAWEAERLQGPRLEEALEHWRSRLEGVGEPLRLPTDRPVSPARSRRAGTVHRPLPRVAGEGLTEFARERGGATPFMALLTAVKAVLHLYSGIEDVVLGSPVAGRGRREIAGLIGCFINTLVLRTSLAGDPTLEELLERVRRTALAAFGHQELPLERLVESLGAERTGGDNPLFRVLFATENVATDTLEIELPGLTGAPLEPEDATAKLDLVLTIKESSRGPVAWATFDADLFDETTVLRLLGHLERALVQLVTEPGRRLSELALLSPAQSHQLRVEWSGAASPSPRQASLGALFSEQARRRPDAVALVHRGGRLTYSRLEEEANRLARHLRGLGVGAETRVGLLFERSKEMVVALLAVLKAGGAYVPLDPAYPRERLALMAEDSRLGAVIGRRRDLQALGESRIPEVAVDEEAAAIAARSPLPPALSKAGAGTLAYVMYTSGSTGRPKGVEVEHRAVVRLVRDTAYIHFGEDEVFLHLAHPSFDASTLELWGPLLHGGRLVLMEEARPSLEAIGEAVRSHGVTTLWLTAGLFHSMVEGPLESLRGVRQLLVGGDVLSPPHVERALAELGPGGCRIFNGYGPTENTTFTTVHPVTAAAGAIPIGRPIAHTRIRVLDPLLRPAPMGVWGELYAGGTGLARGYQGRPAGTAERFVPLPSGRRPGERWYRTGDIVRFSADGVLEFKGRSDFQVKLRGFRVEPGEVQAVLLAEPGVEQAVVLVRPTALGEPALVGYYVASGEAAPEALRASLTRRLPGYLVPSALVPLSALPLKATGKVDREALPNPWGETAKEGESPPSRTPVEELVGGIFAELLGHERVGPEEDFFALGGHSLLATRLVSRVGEAFDLRLSVREIFDAPTPAALAARVEELRRRQGGRSLPELVAQGGSEPAPLSFAQQRLWFLQELEPESAQYHIPIAVRLGGELDVEALSAALTEVVARHGALRTVVLSEGGELFQKMVPAAPVDLPIVDLGGLPPPQAEIPPEARKLTARQALRPFDLATGPVLRGVLLRLRDDDHLLALTLHHIAGDEWSLGILVRELVAVYDARRRGEAASLPPLPVQYTDFARWQRGWLAGDELESELEFWRRTLAGLEPRLNLPTDRPRPTVRRHRGGSRRITLGAPTVAALTALGRRRGVTRFMALLAVFQWLLGRYSGQRDLAVGSPIANRDHRALEGLIGFFANTLVLRANPEGHRTFGDLLRATRKATLAAYDHQHLPFEKLVADLEVERDPSTTPLFQAVFALQTAKLLPQDLPGLACEAVDVEAGQAKFDLTLIVEPREEGLRATAEYDRDLFDGTTVQRLLGHFRRLVEEVTRDPDLLLAELELLSPRERHQLLVEAVTPVARPRDPVPVHHRFEEWARSRPSAPALTFEGGTLSYEELNRRANRVAHALIRRGVGPEALVGVFLDRGPELVVAILAVLKAGGAYVPMDLAYPRERLSWIAEDAAFRILLSGEGLRDRLPEGDFELLSVEELQTAAPGRDTADPEPGVRPENTAYAIYTSGSTGRPKGVPVRHGNVSRLFESTEGWFGFSPDDVWTLFHSSAFDFSVWELWGALANGGRLVVVPYLTSRDVDAFQELLAREGVTVLNQTPSAFLRLVEAAKSPELTRLRWVIFGGEALELSSLRPWFELYGDRRPRLVNMYGITETTVHVTYRPLSLEDLELFAGRSVIGEAIPDLRLYVVDRHLRLVPPGVAGELAVAGRGLARGYMGRPRLTAERFVPDPFSAAVGGRPGARLYRSGDLTRRLPPSGDPAGPAAELEYVGRTDHQVKIRGFRIELGEIESRLLDHPSLRQARVLVRHEGAGEGRLVAYVVAEAEERDAVTAHALRSWLLPHLPEYMVPAAFVTLEELPLTHHGKLDVGALPAPGAESAAQAQGYVAPRTRREAALAEAWGEVLSLERVGVTESFFALGGDSILSIQARTAAQRRGVDFTLAELFRHPTIAALAAATADAGEAPEEPEGESPFDLLSEEDRRRVPAGVEDAYPMTFLQRGMVFHSGFDAAARAYHNVSSVVLAGPVDLAALEAALAEAARRHPVLRTSFEMARFSEPLQLVWVKGTVPLRVTDLRGLEEASRRRAVAEILAAERKRAFDPAHPPLLRVSVQLLDEGSYRFTWTEHHGILDGWSVASLLAELFALYAHHRGAGPAPSSPPGLTFRRFVALERQALEDPAQDRFWREHLEGATRWKLSPWAPPKEAREGNGTVEHALAPERVGALEDLAELAGVPLKTVLLALHLRALAAAGGQEDVTTGLVTNGRPEVAEADRVLGLFLNTVPFRLRLSGGSWIGLFRRTFAAEQELMAARRFPLAEIQRRLGGDPLFEVMFNFVHFHVLERAEGLGELAGAGMEEHAETNLPLQVDFARGAGGRMSLKLHYDRSLYPRAQILSLADLYRRMLEAMLRDPRAGWRREDGLGPGERHQILVEWNDTGRALGPWASLHGLVEEQARRTPEAVALRFEGEELTYRELDRRSAALAHRLRARGVGPEVFVGVCLERSLELPLALLAVLKAGGAFLPLDPEYPPARLRLMIQEAGLSVILAASNTRPVLSPLVGSGPVAVLDVGAPMEADGAIDGEPLPAPAVHPDHPAYVLYTSGSTGRPKGAVNSHRAIVNRLRWKAQSYRLGPDERYLQKTPVSFDVSVWELFVPLMTGATMVLAKPGGHRDPAYLAGLIQQEGITMVHFVPTLLQAFLDEPSSRGCTSLRRVIASGEAVSRELERRFFERLPAELHNLYGPTEAAVDVTATACRPHRRRSAVPIGRPISNVRIRVLDRALKPVKAGVAGELMIGGVALARGYLERPALTAERFVPDPFDPAGGGRLYRTGDLAAFRPDGEVDFLGRLDHQVKIRGQRVELGEIEAALLELEEVSEAAVLAREDEGDRPRLVAYAVLSGSGEEAAPSVRSLRRRLSRRLPEAMIPAAFVFLPAMPLLPNGKLDRRSLPLPAAAPQAPAEGYQAPESPEEEILAEVWAQLLGRERIGVQENFFELGGDSILSIQVVARAARRGLRINPAQIFEHRTVAELARVAKVEDAPEGDDGPLEGPLPLTPIQRWFFRLSVADPHHWNQAVALELRPAVPAEALDRAVAALGRHHDALRLRFEPSREGWTQRYAPARELPPFHVFDLSGLEPEAQREAMERLASGLQRSLDLGAGPIARVALFALGPGAPDRLLVIVHHLAVDGVSWRILLQDLEAAVRPPPGRPVTLPPRTVSYRRWAEALASAGEPGQGPVPAPENPATLPLDGPGGVNTVASQAAVEVELTAPETADLLRRVPPAYRTEIGDVLLTALVQAVRSCAPRGEGAVVVDLEGHGRARPGLDLDTSRTVGWFTTLDAVTLDPPPAGSPGPALKTVKEVLRSVAKGEKTATGTGGAPAQILFNYLGQTDAALAGSRIFAFKEGPTGPSRSPRGERSHALEVQALVSEGRLRLHWLYSRHLHREVTVERLAERFLDALRRLIAHCLSPEAGGFTPSDFPLAGLGAESLDRLLEGRTAIEDVYPLSPLQQGLLFHTVQARGRGVYVLQLTCTLEGELDLEALQRAWQTVIDRHSVLRTSFELRGLEEPLQLVHHRAPAPWRLEDWRKMPPADQETRFEGLIREDRRRSFEIDRPPLMRFTLVRVGEEASRLLWSHHHLLLDGWSWPLVFQEVLACYAAYRAGREPRLPRPRPYREFIAWLRAQDPEAPEAFWKERLQGLSAPTPLTVDRPAEEEGGEAGALNLVLPLPEGPSARLAAFARESQLTLSTLVQGAWALLLSRYSGRREVLFGTTVSGRQSGPEGMGQRIGVLINSLPVRARIETAGDPAAWLQGLQQELARMRRFEHTPLDRIHGWSGIPRDRPLFESLTVFQNYPNPSAGQEPSGLVLKDFRVAGSTNYPLVLIAQPGEPLQLRLAVQRQRFDRSTAERLLAHLANLLAGLPTARRLADLDLLSEAERVQLTAEWGGLTPAPEATSPLAMFAARVAKAPGAVAVSGGGEALTYGQLDERSHRLAHHLRESGVGRGDRVALLLDRSPALVVAILAVLKSGAAYVPLAPELPAKRLRYVVEDSRVRLVVTEETLAGELPPSVPHLLLSKAEAARASHPAPSLAGEPAAEDLAYVIYTSGSTGRPKGVAVSHGNVQRLLSSTEAWFSFGPDDVWTLFHSYAFDFSVWEIWGALAYGGRLVMVPYRTSRSPEIFYRLLSEEGVTVLNQTPSAFRQLLWAEAGSEPLPLALRWVIFGGEALELASLRPWFDRHGDETPTLVNMYGITETTVHVTYRPLRRKDLEAAGGAPGSVIGRPIPDLRLILLDREGHPAPVGVPGEILVGGEGPARGYLRRPALTAERFVPDPFSRRPGARLYRSGDLGRYLPDGDVEYLGRIDQQVQLRGFRVELGEIEAALAALDEVREAAVLAREDEPGEMSLVAYVVFGAGASEEDLPALRDALAATLPDYMVPAAWVALESLPLTANGKLDRRALAALSAPAAAGRAAPVEGSRPPEGPLETYLAGLWEEVLGVDRVGADDDFFSLGGSSLVGVRLINRLQEDLGEIVHVVTLFDAPTVARMSELLAAQYPAAVARLTGRVEKEEVPPAAPESPARRLDEARVRAFEALVPPLSPSAGAEETAKRNPPAVFVLSPPRAGSTLLRVMLGGHPSLFAPPELELLGFATLAERRATFAGRDRFWREGLVRAVMEISGQSAKAAEEVIAGWEEQGATTRQVYGQLQEWLGDRLLVDKTPSYALDPRILERAEEDFAGAFYIHLIRHPHGMIHSFEEAKLDQIFFRREHAFSRRELAELIWLVSHRNIGAFLDRVPAERQVAVRFEDLVTEPERELGKVCRMLGVELSSEMLRPYRGGRERMVDGVHQDSRMLGDVKFHLHRKIDPTVAHRWREKVREDFLGEPTWELAASFGYARSRGVEALEPSGWSPGEPLPLSFAQERLWFLEQLLPGQRAYHLRAAYRVVGDLDGAALERAFRRVAERHGVLRTRFSKTPEGRPVQIVEPPGELRAELPRIDLRGLAPAAAELALRDLVAGVARRPFDLEAGRLLRLALVHLGEGDHALLAVLHHLVTDGWSMEILVREVAHFYASFEAGEAPSLEPLDLQYVDFARWQRRRLRDDVLEAELAYWRERLAGVSTLELPTDRPRPPVMGDAGAVRRRRFGGTAAAGLRSLAKGSGASPFLVGLAVFSALLARHSGQRDLAVGTPVAGREHVALEGLIGMFVNTLTLRLDAGGDPSFREHLEGVRRVTVEALGHQELPFEKVVAHLRPERDPGRTPLFQVMFAYQEAAARAAKGAPATAGASEWRPLPVAETAAQFDLTLTLAEAPSEGGLLLAAEFRTDLFDGTTVDRLLSHFGNLLQAAAREPGRSLSALPMLGPGERHQLVVEVNDTAVAAAERLSVPALFRRRVERSPASPAVLFRGRSVSYAELDGRARHLARRLQEAGVGAEGVVAVCLPRGPGWVAAVLGILQAGAVYLPLDPDLPERRRAQVLEAARPAALVVAPESEMQASGEPPVIPMEDAGEPPDEGATPPPKPGLELEASLAYVVFTSGTTGTPKGVGIPRGHLAAHCRDVIRRYGLGPEDTVLQFLAPGFDASLEQLLPPLLSGARLLVRDENLWGPAELARQVEEAELTVLDLPMAYWRRMMGLWSPEDLAKLAKVRLLLVGGEALRGADLEAWRSLPLEGVRLLNVYGPTEATVTATCWEAGAEGTPPAAAETPPIGEPLNDRRAHLLDAHGRTVPRGAVGELCLGGLLARGYLGLPAATAAAFVPDPFSAVPGERLYRTGDLARRRDGRLLEFVGRRDQQVKIRGQRVELEEIESHLSKHPSVAEAAVVVQPDAAGDGRLVAFVVPAAGDLEGEALRAFLRQALPESMVPASFVAAEALPVAASGKVDRGALPRAEERPRPAPRAPGNRLERSIAEVWRQVLQVEAVGVDDNFFDLGGHSLHLVEVQSRLREVVGKEVPVVELFRHPTVRRLAEALGREERAPREGRIRPRPVAGPAGKDLAIVGLAARFPGARTADELWSNLRDGVESISFFSDEELAAAGVDAATLADPRLIRSRAYLPDPELFDAGLFEYTPREAELMDPQVRAFLEVSWEALEDAGYLSTAGGPVGVFGGASTNTYLWANLVTRPDVLAAAGAFQTLIANDRDHLTTHVSYKLRLTGPSLTVQTACSTSLVAVAMAAQSLLAGQCELALAGGVTIRVPGKQAQLYEPGGIASPDGHCRPFDAGAQGTVSGDGVGVIVLKRLEDALADGDHVRAVLKGFAVNNDGANKVGYTAPSVEGQAEVIRNALAMAAVDPETVSYVEAHGTATPLGDPIELSALKLAFGGESESPPRPGACAVGSIKSNLGHTDAAAGVAGLIKTVLALEHGELPPSLHFERPNPALELEGSRFFVNDRLRPWQAEGPRRAGVSSFGIGGTNAHVVLEEAPRPPRAPAAGRKPQLLVVSANSEDALARARERLADRLDRLAEEPDSGPGGGFCLADAAFTLQVGRRELPWRAAVVAGEPRRAASLLRGSEPGLRSRRVAVAGRPTVFLFPGQGAQTPNMARQLFEEEAEFRRRVNACAEILTPLLDHDLRSLLFADREPEEAAARLTETRFAQPALFVVEWALARQWMDWGIEPWAMLGHSLGELVAACLAGVFSLEDALLLVAERGRLMQERPPGAMVSVELSQEELEPWLGEELSLAAVNGEALCSVGGDEPAVARLEAALTEAEIRHRRLRTSHAFHSPAMKPAADAFREVIRKVSLHPPQRPFLSNLSGDWIAPEEATDPEYWCRHLLRPVRFADGLRRLLEEPDVVFLEVGPGRALGTLVRLAAPGAGAAAPAVVHSLPAPGDPESKPAQEGLLDALGQLWLLGGRPHWPGLYPEGRRRRMPLPTYPFARQRHWIERRPGGGIAAASPGTEGEAPPEPEAEALQARDLRPGLDSLYAPPRTDTERLLVEIWQEMLGVGGVGVDDDFFELGGHSLLATRIAGRVREALACDVPLEELFNAPTVAGMARAMDRLLPSEAPGIPRLGDRQHLPLSPAQERLWFLYQLDPANPAYNLPFAFRLRGPLDVRALRRSFEALVERHEVLRTTYALEGGRSVQKVHPKMPPEGAVVDLRALKEASREAELLRLAGDQSRRPADLEKGPLLEAVIARCGDEDWAVLATVHHIACDGWSFGLIAAELSASYNALSDGREPARPELEIQYADFAAWQRRRLEAGDLDRQLDYWRERLAALGPPLELPIAKPSGDAAGFHGLTHRLEVSPAVTRPLKGLARRSKATLFMVLQAALDVLLSHLSGQEDIVIGSPVAGRSRPETEGLVGFFVNTLVLRTDVSGNPTFLELLTRVRRNTLAAYAHQEVPLQTLSAALDRDRDPAASLFRVWLVLQNQPESFLDLSGLTLAPIPQDECTVRHDLNLSLGEAGGGLVGDIQYRRDLFEAAAIAEMERLFQLLLEAVGRDPGSTVEELKAALAQASRERSRAGRSSARQANLEKLKNLRRKRRTAS